MRRQSALWNHRRMQMNSGMKEETLKELKKLKMCLVAG